MKKRVALNTRAAAQIIDEARERRSGALEILGSAAHMLHDGIYEELHDNYQLGSKAAAVDASTSSGATTELSDVLSKWTSCEVMEQLIQRDGMKLLFGLVARMNKGLYFERRKDDMYEELLGLEESNRQARQNDAANAKCEAAASHEQKTLARTYYTMKALEGDDDRDVYFEPQHDSTRYDTLNEHANERASMTYEAFREFLMRRLMEHVGFSDEDAYFEADSILQQKRLVRDGDYACLKVARSLGDGVAAAAAADEASASEAEVTYYVRRGGRWRPDKGVSHEDFESLKRCDLGDAGDDGCRSPSEGECSSEKVVLRDVEMETVRTFIMSEAHDIEHTAASLEQAIHVLLRKRRAFLTQMRLVSRMNESVAEARYNGALHARADADADAAAAAASGSADAFEPSPYVPIRDAILSQSDFIRKQGDIIRFCSLCTRVPHKTEDRYWLRCTKSDAKLLPLFMYKIACSVVQNNNYAATVQAICQDQGTIGEDGSSWVDKHSGYFIAPLADDSREGFDKDGYKKQSNDVMVVDEGASSFAATGRGGPKANAEVDVLSDLRNISDIRKTLDVHTESTMRSIAIVVDALYTMMGISDKGAKTNIVVDMTHRLKTDPVIANSQLWEQYKRKNPSAIEKRPSWELKYNQVLIQGTLAYIVTYVTTNVPSHTSQKVFPTCRASFDGFPVSQPAAAAAAAAAAASAEAKQASVGAKSTNDCLNYVCCIAHALKRRSFHPWSSIENINKEGIVTRVRQYIERQLIPLPSIIAKIRQKEKHMEGLAQREARGARSEAAAAASARLVAASDGAADEDMMGTNLMHQSWPNFMPVLTWFRMERPQPFGETYDSEFIKTLRDGRLKSIHVFWDKYNVVQAKIRKFSFAIQRDMQRVISKEEPLLMDVNRSIYLENSCCRMATNNVYEFMTEREKSISEANHYIRRIHRTYIRTFARYVSSRCVQTRFVAERRAVHRQYAVRTPDDERVLEELVFRVAIEACNLGDDGAEIPPEFTAICPYKPKNISSAEFRALALSEKIGYLKGEGLQFDLGKLIVLMKVAARRGVFVAQTAYERMRFHPLAESNRRALRLYEAFPAPALEADSVVDKGAIRSGSVSISQGQFARLARNSAVVLDANVRRMYAAMTSPSDGDGSSAKQSLIAYVETLAGLRYSELRAALGAKGGNTRTTALFSRLEEVIDANKRFKAVNDGDYLRTSDDGRRQHAVASYYKNIIVCAGAVLPSMHLNRKLGKEIPHGVPKYWNLSNLHAGLIGSMISKLYANTVAWASDATCDLILREMLVAMRPVVAFVRECVSLHTYSSAMGAEATFAVLKYVFISMIHYIVVYTPGNMALVERHRRLATHTENVRDATSLRDAVAKLTKGLILTFHSVLSAVNFSYAEATRAVTHLEYEERRKITGRFKGNDEEKRIQYELKLRKLGQWNVDVRNGVQVHNKDKFDADVREQNASGAIDSGAFLDADALQLHLREQQSDTFTGDIYAEDYDPYSQRARRGAGAGAGDEDHVEDLAEDGADDGENSDNDFDDGD